MDEQLFKIFDEGAQREGTECEKWDSRKEVFGRADVIPLWVADMDFPSPAAVRDALVERAQQGVYGYTQSLPRNRQAVASWMKKRHGADVQTDWILSSPGVVDSLREALKIFTKPGDGVVVQPPVYGPFFRVTEQVGCRILRNRLINTDEGWRMDFEDLERHFADGAKAMLLCSPHNPGGRVWTREELEKLDAFCQKHNIFVIADEIHNDLILTDREHIMYGNVSEHAKMNSIICTAPSKTFNLAGIQGSNILIANEEVRKVFQAQVAKAHASANDFAGPATIAAYNESEAWLDELLEVLKSNSQYFVDFIHEHCPELKVRMNEATYLMWLDCRGLGMTEEELGKWFAEKVGIAANAGSWFGKTGTNFRRLNMACPRSFVEDACQRIEKAVKELRK